MENAIGRSNAHLRDRFLALVDLREQPAYLLDHPWLSEQASEQLEDRTLKQRLQLTAEQRTLVEEGRPSGNYVDPIGAQDERYKGPWLVAFAPIGETGWTAVVQERRSSAVEPVQNLRQVFVKYGIGAVVAMTLVFALLGSLLYAASR